MKTLLPALQLFLFIIILTSINGYSQTVFSDPIIIQETLTDHPVSVFSADLDGDGDMDMLSASSNDNKIAWYENIDNGTFGSQKIICETALGAWCVYAADLDGDGDVDIISASSEDHTIAWYENINNTGVFSSQKVISTLAFGAKSVFAIDLDGDNDIDILSASEMDNKIAWYENTDGLGNFSDFKSISASAHGAHSVFSIDIDNDGDNDVLSASSDDDKIAWYENTTGAGSFSAEKIISITANGAKCVYAADLDNDGDNDVISASFNSNKVEWYENTNGNGTFGDPTRLRYYSSGAWSVFAADIDGDNDMDILSASIFSDKIDYWENTDGQGNFGIQKTLTNETDFPCSVYVADIDNDSYPDLLSASWNDNKIAWYKNNGLATFGPQYLLTSSVKEPKSVVVADFDGDNNLDIASASRLDNKIALYKNINGSDTFSKQNVISKTATYVKFVNAADLDGDSDMDILSASGYDNKIAWYKNTDGLGNFSSENIISQQAENANYVFAADLDGDSDMDVLSASEDDNKIAWYENTDGLGSFSSQKIISSSAIMAICVIAADIDGDSDMDVISASREDNKIAWYKNIDGNGVFTNEIIISTSVIDPRSVFCADIDGDGDTDIISGSSYSNKIIWFENTDGLGNFGSEVIISNNAVNLRSVFATDLDEDNDIDIVSTSYGDNKLAWYENTDGIGTFGDEIIISSLLMGTSFVYSADIDSDNDMDIITTSETDNRICLFINLHETIQANEDISTTATEFQLKQNYPNPFNKITIIPFSTYKNSHVELSVYNIKGEKVSILFNEFCTPGDYQIPFNAASIPSGIYFYKLQIGKSAKFKKMVFTASDWILRE
ncbi:FG-GAP-like repeat-containing protein [Bacteroidota bacterium]